MIEVDFSSLITMLFTTACVVWVTVYVRRLSSSHEEAEKKKREVHAERDEKIAALVQENTAIKIEQAGIKATQIAQTSTMVRVEQNCDRILDILTRQLKISPGGHE